MASRTREELLKFIVATEGDDEIKALVKDLIKLGDSSEGSAKKANALLGKIESLAAVSNNIQSFTKLKASLSEFGDKITLANKKVTELEAKLLIDPGNAGLQRQLDRARVAAIELEKEQNRLTVALTRTSNALNKEGVDTAKLGSAFQDLQAKMGKARQEAAGFTNQISKSSAATSEAGAGISKLGSLSTGAAGAVAGVAAQLATVAIAATTAAAAITAIYFKDAVDSSIEFDTALTEVAAVSGATGDALGRLKIAAEAGGAATKFSSIEAAQGLTELARATGDADAAIAALTPTLNLAQAGGIGVADAATFVTTTLTQFNLEADKAALVADLFATEANTTSDTVTGLGNAMSYSAPLARQLGLSVTDTVAIIGALADQGFRGERAGTALRAVFSALLDPADSFSVALRELGIESTNFNEVIEQLATKGDAGRSAILKLDAAARPAILSLVAAGTGGIGKLNDALAASSGSAEKFAQVIGGSFAAAQERLSGSFDQNRRDLVEPILQPLILELNKLSEEFNTFSKSEDFKLLRAELTELFTEAGLAVKDFLGEIDFQEVVRDIRQFAVDSKQSIGEFRTAIGGVIAIVETFGDGIVFTFNIIQAFIQGVAALLSKVIASIAGLFDAIIKPGQELREVLGLNNDALNAFSDAAITFSDIADKNATSAYENLGEAGGALVDLVGQTEDITQRAVSSTTQVAAANDTAAASAENLAAAATESAAGIEKQSAAADAASGKTDALAKENEAAAARIKAAFSDLGLRSQAELTNAAASAKRNFEVIVVAASEGKAATDDVRRAFVAYAQAAIAATKDGTQSARDRVNAELSVKAASLGVRDAFEQMGASGGAATKAITAGANQASAAVNNIADSADQAAEKIDEVGAASVGAAGKIGAMKALAGGLVGELSEGSKKFNDMLQAANKIQLGALDNRAFSEEINDIVGKRKAQEDAAKAVIDETRQQNKLYDVGAQKIDALRQQYDLLSDAQLQALLQEQDTLEKNLETHKQITAEKQNQSQVSSFSNVSSSAGNSSRSTVVEKVIVVRLELNDESLDLQYSGNESSLNNFLSQLSRARSVSTRR